MSQDGVHYSLLPQVPDFHRIVVATSRNLISVGQEVDRDDLVDMGWELQNVLAAS